MTSAPLPRWQPALCTGLLTALATSGIAGCHTIQYVYPKNMQGFELPRGCPPGSPPTNTTQLNACLRGIEFDTMEFVGDEQRLMVRELRGRGLPCFGEKDSGFTCRYGPLAKVEPVKGAELYSKEAMAEGRIIARIYLRPRETESYDKFNLAPGDITYWWVKFEPDTSQFIRKSARGAELSLQGRQLSKTPHPPGSFQQAFAQWVWDPTDEKLNAGCPGACCKSP